MNINETTVDVFAEIKKNAPPPPPPPENQENIEEISRTLRSHFDNFIIIHLESRPHQIVRKTLSMKNSKAIEFIPVKTE